MTYKQIINIVENTALKQVFVKSFNEGDVYDINSKTDNPYGMVVITPLQHQYGNNTATFNFNIFYIDRLLSDNSNKIDIQSNGFRAIIDILNYIDLNYNVVTNRESINLEVFTEKFSDDCAGVFGQISLQTFGSQSDCEQLIN